MATTPRNPVFSLVLAATAALLAGRSGARGGDWMPLLPDQDFYDMQLFAPPDLREYSTYKRPKEGLFLKYDRLYWSITVPQVTDVAETARGGYLIPNQPISPQTIVQLNNAGFAGSGPDNPGANVIGGIYPYGSDPLVLDLNTGWMKTAMSWGNRFEGGWIYDNRGVEISYWNTGDQSQQFETLSEFAASSPTQIFSQQTAVPTGAGVAVGGIGGGGAVQPTTTTTITSNSGPPDHLVAQKLNQLNSTEIYSVGVSAILRRELGKRGSGDTMRFSIGPRFVQFADRYRLQYESNQYVFSQGPVGGGQGQGVNIGQVGGTGQQQAQGIGGGGCWVAREVYGVEDGRWLVFRGWLVDEAPDWFRDLYTAHGEAFAAWIHDQPAVRAAVRSLMDLVVEPRLTQAAALGAAMGGDVETIEQ